MDIPTTEPKEITAGDTAAWTKSLSDYLASDGYTLNYRLQLESGGTPITVAASASGADHAVSVSASTTAGWSAGRYRWYSYVTKSAERYSIDTGILTILPDPAVAGFADLDQRSFAKVCLDAIEAVLAGEATTAQLNMTIDGDRLEKKSPMSLISMRDRFKQEVRREEAAEAIRKGLDTGHRILTRFV